MIVKFGPRDALIIISTKVLGPSGEIVVKLALDTGASRSLLRWDALDWLGYHPDEEQT
jgi:hypothetical protein